MPAREGAPTRTPALARVVDELRAMIVSGELSPGQQIRQESMAERLKVSRLPIREALRQLTVEGLVRHTPNVGYMVARLNQGEFDQIYLMRKLLEDEIIGRLPVPTSDQLDEIVAINDRITVAANEVDLATMRAENQEFHFAIFELSGLRLLIDEVERLWTWAAPYHSVYLFSAEGRLNVLEEHAVMIEALRTGDNDLMARTMEVHRHGSESQLKLLLGPSGGAPVVLT